MSTLVKNPCERFYDGSQNLLFPKCKQIFVISIYQKFFLIIKRKTTLTIFDWTYSFNSSCSLNELKVITFLVCFTSKSSVK